ncbi:MAG: hypothetical protein GXO78_07195 [Calditrichaeota bacterium]|nr:hypothetical protein [Calditrichota bacterium]
MALLVILFACSVREPLAPGSPDSNKYTELQGTIEGILYLKDAPFLVTGSLIVPENKTLVIQAGVTLYFEPHTALIVQGNVSAIGRQDSFITFTAKDESWQGIQLFGRKTPSVFRFCIIEKIMREAYGDAGYGGVVLQNASATFMNCLIRKNRAFLGGGLVALESELELFNNIFKENQALSMGGAVLLVQSRSRVINNTFFKNYSQNVGGALVLFNPVFDELQNNIVFQNRSDQGDPRLEILHAGTDSYLSQYNFFSVDEPDPLFLSETDLRLQPNSPCRDQGNPAPEFRDPDGTRNDQGAFGGPLGDWISPEVKETSRN